MLLLDVWCSLLDAHLCLFIGWRCSLRDALLCGVLCVVLFVWCSLCDALCLMLFCGVTSFIANYLITLPQACKPVFFSVLALRKGGRKTTHCKLTKRTVQSAVVVAIKLTKSRIFRGLVSENTGETLFWTYKKSHFGWFGCKSVQKGWYKGITGGAKM